MLIGYHTICWGGVVGTPSGVTSVKDLYYRTAGLIEAAVEEIAAAGYSAIEAFDGDLVDPPGGHRGWRELLQRSGLELVSVYCGANLIYPDILADELARLEIAADAAAALGATQIVLGGGARRAGGTLETDYGRLAYSLDLVGELAERHGLRASYHPHLGTMAETPEEIDQVLARTGIAFCPDTAHLVAGGGDPAALIRRYGNRVAHVHLKDLAIGSTRFVPLGAGRVDFASVFTALAEVHYDGCAVVELDTYEGDPAEAARICRSYLDAVLPTTSSGFEVKRAGGPR